jgi:hypothetical protein
MEFEDFVMDQKQINEMFGSLTNDNVRLMLLKNHIIYIIFYFLKDPEIAEELNTYIKEVEGGNPNKMAIEEQITPKKGSNAIEIESPANNQPDKAMEILKQLI